MDLTAVTDHVNRIEHLHEQTPYLSRYMPLKFDSGVVMYVPKHNCKHCNTPVPPGSVRGTLSNVEPGKYATINSTVHCAECNAFYFDCYSVRNTWNGIDILVAEHPNEHDEVVQRIRMPFHSAVTQLIKRIFKQ